MSRTLTMVVAATVASLAVPVAAQQDATQLFSAQKLATAAQSVNQLSALRQRDDRLSTTWNASQPTNNQAQSVQRTGMTPRHRMIIGALVGALGGGLTAGGICRYSEAYCGGRAAAMVAGGAGIGAGVGWLLGKH